ncbi:restriction endonuclease subunit S [Enterococcus faecium]
MQEERTNVPKIRFKGYAEEWEERKLRDITERVRGNDGRMDLPTLTISASSGWLDQRDRFSGNIAGKEQKNYTLLKKGQLSYNHGNSKLAKYGAVFELTTYDEALVPRVYHSFDTNELASSNFIEYMFATKRPDRELAKLVSSGARMDGLLNINFDEFMGINVSVPSVGEQQKIGSFFKQLDDTIALHQRGLDLLKQTKQSYLQKMFPKKGEDKPEIRFAGFTDAWEQRKLSGIIEKLSGGACIKPTDYLEDGIRTIPKGAVNATGIADLSGSKYISEDFFEKNITSHVHTNNLVTSLRDLVPSAPNMGRIVRIEGDDEQFLMPQGVYKLELFEGMDEDFLISFSNSDKYRKIISAEKNGSTQVHIRNGEFLNIDINLPSEHEQKKIGTFFKQLDDIITLHQRELNSLKEMKKTLLQQMFV